MIFIERPLGMEDAESVCCGFEKAGRDPDFCSFGGGLPLDVWGIGGRNVVAVADDHGDRYYGFFRGVNFPMREADVLTMWDFLMDGPFRGEVAL